MLGIAKSDDLPENPDAEEVEEYDETGENGPSSDPGLWRLDLVGPKKSRWNKAAARRFRRHFLECEQYGRWPAEQVEKALFVHMDTLRVRYMTQTGQRSLDERLQAAIKAARVSRLKTVSVKLLPLTRVPQHSSHTVISSTHNRMPVGRRSCRFRSLRSKTVR